MENLLASFGKAIREIKKCWENYIHVLDETLNEILNVVFENVEDFEEAKQKKMPVYAFFHASRPSDIQGTPFVFAPRRAGRRMGWVGGTYE